MNQDINGPIEEGQWYELIDNGLAGKAVPCHQSENVFVICGFRYKVNGYPCLGAPRKIRRIWPVQTDPAEVVAELRAKASDAETRKEKNKDHEIWRAEDYAQQAAFSNAADLVQEKLNP